MRTVGIGSTSADAGNPATVYVYPYGSTHGEAFIASLSGVVARTSPEVFMGVQGSSPSHDPEFWLDRYIADHPGTQKIYNNSLPFYIDRYKSQLSGYVLYNDASINEATSVAGALGAAMVHESLLPSISSSLSGAGLSQVEDVRGRDSTWVYNNYGSMLNKNMIFRQMPSFNQQLRSYAVLNKGFVFNNTGATRDTFLAAQNDNTRVFGWGFGGSETEFFGSASQHNLMGSAGRSFAWLGGFSTVGRNDPSAAGTHPGQHADRPQQALRSLRDE